MGATNSASVGRGAPLGLVDSAAARAGHYCWLDGGDGRGWFGLDCDRVIECDGPFGAALDAVERAWRDEPERVWMGWLTYELGAASVTGRAPRPGALPGLVLRRYRAAAEYTATGWRIHGASRAGAALRERLGKRVASTTDEWPLQPLRAALDPERYRTQVRSAKESIAAGDTYQINYAQPFHARWRSGADRPLAQRVAAVYGALRGTTPASMGALIAAPGGRTWIASNSPETLLDVRLGRAGERDVARSWPIKGTRPRGPDHGSDGAAAAALRASEKDAAEHVMIVDLVRNDLGRLAIPGTVQAPRVPELVSLPTVHHLVSEVRCALAPGWRLADLVAAVFPGGSITGAPKRRTIELIEALEDAPRDIYCGAIVVLEPGGLRMSIPIRTAVLSPDGMTVMAGGGIVTDSDPEAERLETIAKTRAFDRV